jgi:hypothetical protein
MFCKSLENEGILYLYDELDSADRKNFETHILNCSRCRSAVEQFRETRDFYQKVEVDAPSIWTLLLLKLKSRTFTFFTRLKKFFLALSRQKKLWIPATVSLAIIFISLAIIKTFQRKSNIPVNSEEILEWTILSDDSVNSLDQQMDDIFAKNVNIKKINGGEEAMNVTDSMFDDDFGLTEIKQDIILLSWDINQSYF